MNTSRRSLSAEAADAIRGMVSSVESKPNSYLPAERELVKRLGVSRVTVRRALSQLVSEGLIESVPQQGYRPVKSIDDDRRDGPMAYVLAQVSPDHAWDLTHEQIITAFSRQLMSGGRQVLAVGAEGRDAAEVFTELAAKDVWGVALDTSRDDFIDAAARSRLPVVVVDAHTHRTDIDIVIQDNFGGAHQATTWLIEKGHERIAWVGPMRGLAHYRERFAGACAAMNDAGRKLVPELTAEVADNDSEEEAALRVKRMLKSRRPPTSIVCMWQAVAQGAIRAIREAGLTVGGDVEIVAWATEREYREVLAPEFLGELMPATVVWQPDEMAALAVERLEKRAGQDHTPVCRTDVRVRLVEPQRAEDVLRRGARSVARRP